MNSTTKIEFDERDGCVVLTITSGGTTSINRYTLKQTLQLVSPPRSNSRSAKRRS